MHGAAQHIPGYQQYSNMMGAGGGRRDLDPNEMPAAQPYVPDQGGYHGNQSGFPSAPQHGYNPEYQQPQQHCACSHRQASC